MTQQPETPCADGWSPRRIDLLRLHHAQGLTARQSAELLGGVTRHAVISKRHRIGLICLPRARRILAVLPPVVRGRLKLLQPPKLRAKPVPQMDLPPPPGAKPKRLRDRRANECAWPLGPAETEGDHLTLFCCAPRQGRWPYCAAHGAIAYDPAPEAVK
jgi:hypothetical protein